MVISRNHLPRLLVTGGSGFLGRHVVDGPRSDDRETFAPGSGTVDLRDRDATVGLVRDWRPDAIIHTAYRRDDRAAIVDATEHVAHAAIEVGARLVHVSTDAVFAGRAAAYTELDPPDPVHDYGRDKADAEAIVARIDPGAVIVRTSLILGVDELSPHERAVDDAIEGRTSTAFFTDEVRSPVLVTDLAAALVALSSAVEPTGVLHLGGPTALSRARLAVMIARRHGWDDSALRFSSIAESGLTRPANVVLDSARARRYGFAVRGPAEIG